MPHEKSLTRARYAVSVLRIATDAPVVDAKRLIAAIASEFPHTDTPADVIETEVAAIASFKHLAAGLDGDPARRQHLWTVARNAAEAWERRAAISCHSSSHVEIVSPHLNQRG